MIGIISHSAATCERGIDGALDAIDSDGKPSKGRIRGVGPRLIPRQTCSVAAKLHDVIRTKDLAI
jgi:hypothetical protein